MTEAQFEPIHLHRIDPIRNMARFYSVSVEKTLFGETVIRRNWGRIGTDGRSITTVVKEVAEAKLIAAGFCDAKRRRGYWDVSCLSRGRDGLSSKRAAVCTCTPVRELR